MIKISKLLAPAAAACLLLAGCTLPGEQAQGSGKDEYVEETTASTVVQQKEEVINYRWALKPSVTCDNIITPDRSMFDASDLKYKAFLYTSVICEDGKFGFIDLNGNMVVYPEFQNYYMMPDGQVILSSVGEDGSTKICYLDDYLRRVEEYLEPTATKLKEFYWSEKDNKIYRSESDGYVVPLDSDDTVAVCKADIGEMDGRFYVSNIHSDAYALADNGGLMTDFEYEDCYVPSYGDPSSSMIALKKNGLWGYFDESGNKVLDFKFYDMPSAYTNNAANSEEKSHPNLFSEGYVAVQNEMGGGYYTKEGSLLIPMGTFTQVRPIQSGRAWVNVGGLWGVITLGEVSDLKMPKVTTTTTTTTTTTYKQTWSQTTTTAPVVTQPVTTAAPVVTTVVTTTTTLPQTTSQTTEAVTEPPETTPAAVDTTKASEAAPQESKAADPAPPADQQAE